ncbi:hypothetical protein HN51_052385 [Arachis hypogaea]
MTRGAGQIGAYQDEEERHPHSNPATTNGGSRQSASSFTTSDYHRTRWIPCATPAAPARPVTPVVQPGPRVSFNVIRLVKDKSPIPLASSTSSQQAASCIMGATRVKS